MHRLTLVGTAAVLGTAAAVLGTAIALLAFLGVDGDDLLGRADGGGQGRLVVEQAYPVNGREFSGLIDGDLVQTEESSPQIDVTLRNTGTAPILLTEARVTVEDSARLPTCLSGSGGDVPSSRPIAVFLPALPIEDEMTVSVPLHKEVAGGQLERFPLLFGVDDRLDDRLYALHVELIAEHPHHVVDTGRFVMGVPGPVNRAGNILPEDETVLEALDLPYQRRYRMSSVWCFRRNLAELARLIGRPGDRSPEIVALSTLQPAPGWKRYADAFPARSSVEPLIHKDLDREALPLAAYAAEQTGDAGFAARTRERVATLLLKRARQELDKEDGYAGWAVDDIRTSLRLVQSPEATALLGRAEAMVAKEEKRVEEEEARLSG